jgi:hypothetical protein
LLKAVETKKVFVEEASITAVFTMYTQVKSTMVWTLKKGFLDLRIVKGKKAAHAMIKDLVYAL